MLVKIPYYLLRKTRVELKLTPKKAAEMLDIDISYLSKIENGKTEIPAHLMRIFFNRYQLDQVDTDFLDFDERLMEYYITRIVNATLSDEQVAFLELKRKRYSKSFYEIYIILLLFAYRVTRQQYDDEFFEDAKNLERYIVHFPDYYQYFFYCFAAHYMIRLHRIDEYKQYEEKLQNYPYSSMKIIQCYSKIEYIEFNREYFKLPLALDECKELLKKEKNEKIEKALIFIEGTYYQNTHDYHHAIQTYERYANVCMKDQEMDNYGIAQYSIAFLYHLQRKLDDALQHYLLAQPYMNYSDFYFDLAWCYYNLNDFEQALSMIQNGKKAQVDHPKWMIFLEWLENMIMNPYGKRSKQKLYKIYNEYFDTLGIDLKNFVLTGLVNQAKHDHEVEVMNDLMQEMVELNIETNYPIEKGK